ncbi:hypothetical protein F0223_06710 [Vibrio coralliilyticus]|uniref:hypothetical protein n=1 Tax=Vibrio coralliilyticus TaxID=190893 RepID=UPI00148C9BFC|nr:hypothetical protein [Vibrio coralliilyticus]NOI17921.1 hypothetical protein [Vibrio coralliilyticus]
MKKITFVHISVVFSAFILFGCGSGSSPTPTNPNKTTPNELSQGYQITAVGISPYSSVTGQVYGKSIVLEVGQMLQLKVGSQSNQSNKFHDTTENIKQADWNTNTGSAFFVVDNDAKITAIAKTTSPEDLYVSYLGITSSPLPITIVNQNLSSECGINQVGSCLKVGSVGALRVTQVASSLHLGLGNTLDSKTVSHDSASKYCQKLGKISFSNKSNWRLPNMVEANRNLFNVIENLSQQPNMLTSVNSIWVGGGTNPTMATKSKQTVSLIDLGTSKGNLSNVVCVSQ